MYPPDESAVETPWLTVVGIGVDGWAGLGEAARQAVEQAEWIVGGVRHLAMLPDAQQERVVWPSPLTDAIDTITVRRGRPTCVLATGDPFFYGVGVTLARHVDPREMRVLPHASAFSLAAARMGWAQQNTTCLSVHGRKLARVARHLQDGARLLILSWDGSTPAALARLLVEQGFGVSRITVLSDMGGADEQHLSDTARAWRHGDVPPVNTVALDCVADAPDSALALAAGRDQDRFAHDGQISKLEMRAVVQALLAPRAGELLWDVGAGSGAVAVEWMRSAPDNRAVAVEAKPARCAHIRDNAERFGVPELVCVEGEAPAALHGLDSPDAVFIGGGLTRPGLLQAGLGALAANPRGRLVATCVTTEGEAVLLAAQQQHGGELRRIQLADAGPLGHFQGWAARRPVTIWRWRQQRSTS